MALFKDMTTDELRTSQSLLEKEYQRLKSLHVKLNMARGKPSEEQLELSADMLNNMTCAELSKTESGFETRNYGMLDGIPEAKEFFAAILGVGSENIIVGGNSSLNMMYDSIARAMQFGVCGSVPWNHLEKVRFLCPSPGYDRHFAICEVFGIEMIPIQMGENGPDMDRIEEFVQNDSSIKGIWCVPKYSNPTGITYSDDVVRRFASLQPAAEDFRIFWDNAYAVHDLTDHPDSLLNIFDECLKRGTQHMVYAFCSTSKITFPGAGMAAMAASEKNIRAILKIMQYQTIGHDKINQLRHCKFIDSKQKLKEHMKAHAEILKPKFDFILDYLDKEIAPYGIGRWTRPNGGYFISFNTIPGCAKRVGELCLQADVKLTPAGATFPYGIDPQDENIRIAPTFPPLKELMQAMEIFCVCVKLASVEKILEDRQDSNI